MNRRRTRAVFVTTAIALAFVFALVLYEGLAAAIVGQANLVILGLLLRLEGLIGSDY